MSTAYRRCEQTKDLYSRRMSLRAPPLPNPVLDVPRLRSAYHLA
jgi:hypothetical protein